MIQRLILLQICLVFAWTSVMAQTSFTSAGGANYLGLARAGVAMQGMESIYLNQAGIVDVENYGIDLSIERRYNLEELTQLSVSAIKSFKIGTIGLVASSFGFSEYNEQKFGLAYARRLSSRISIGGQFDMLRYNIDEIGSKNLFSIEAGMQLKLSRILSMGVHIFSPGKAKLVEGEVISTRFRTGLRYAPSEKVFLLADLDKGIDKPLEFKIGIGYSPIKMLRVMAGANPVTSSYYFGARINIQDRFRITAASGINQVLGNTPGLSLQYQN